MGDYWTVSEGVANHTGHTCRECMQTIYANSPIYVRDGRKIRLFYHESCFSGNSDPRSQSRSSAFEKWENISPHAPKEKGFGKWWTSSYGYSGASPGNRASSVGIPEQPRRKPHARNPLQRSMSEINRPLDGDFEVEASSSSTFGKTAGPKKPTLEHNPP